MSGHDDDDADAVRFSMVAVAVAFTARLLLLLALVEYNGVVATAADVVRAALRCNLVFVRTSLTTKPYGSGAVNVTRHAPRWPDARCGSRSNDMLDSLPWSEMKWSATESQMDSFGGRIVALLDARYDVFVPSDEADVGVVAGVVNGFAAVNGGTVAE